MLGASHAATGALAGALLTGLSGGGPVQIGAGVLVCAGAALLPDLDHLGSTATRSQGPASRAAALGVRAASRAAWAATRTPHDDGGLHDDRGAHRHLTHTVPAALVVGLGAGLAGVHPLTAAFVVWLLVSLGLRGLGQSLTGRDRAALSQWVTVSVGAALVAAVAFYVDPVPAPILGALVAVGMVVHVLGDWLTPSGVPLAWPLRIRGKRWWTFRSPVPFTAGDCWQETAIRWACWTGAPVAGAWTMMI